MVELIRDLDADRVGHNLERVRQEIAGAGRDPSDVQILAAVKYVPIEELNRGRSNTKPGMRTLAEAEREHILQALRETDWVVGGPHGASTMLGVKRTTLLDKMRRLDISRPGC